MVMLAVRSRSVLLTLSLCHTVGLVKVDGEDGLSAECHPSCQELEVQLSASRSRFLEDTT